MRIEGEWGEEIWMRDPAVIKEGDVWHCFYTHIDKREVEKGKIQLALGRIWSRDLKHWSKPEILLSGENGYSSPGSIVREQDGFLVCLQSYPVNQGEIYGSDACRLWLMKSRDLIHFEKPMIVSETGCMARWANSRRQIDPFLLKAEDRYYMFYKTDGCIGLLKANEFGCFEEGSDDRPVLKACDTPDGVTVENPCVICQDGKYRMFFAPCREGRGIGTAWSNDLQNWKDIQYLDFPKEIWAPGGATAPVVIDDRENSGKWLMFYHGDTEGVHGGALGIAWSDDLFSWNV